MLQLLFNWEGRINRQTYILATIGVIAAHVLMGLFFFTFLLLPWSLLLAVMNAVNSQEAIDIFAIGFGSIFAIAIFMVLEILFFYVTIILIIKRIHDLDGSGWEILVALLLFSILPILQIILWLQPGTFGNNSHGPNTISNETKFFAGISVRPEFQD